MIIWVVEVWVWPGEWVTDSEWTSFEDAVDQANTVRDGRITCRTNQEAQ